MIYLHIPEGFTDRQTLERVLGVIAYRWKNVPLKLLVNERSLPLDGSILYKEEPSVLSPMWLHDTFGISPDKSDVLVSMRTEISDDFNIPIYLPNMDGYAGLSVIGKFDNKACSHLDTHYFSSISAAEGYGLYYFPYTFMQRTNGFGDINEYGFRIPENWREASARGKNEKLILIFGGSAAFDILSKVGERFSDILESRLNEHFKNKDISFRVFNFGASAYVLLNEMTAFTLFCHNLMPDAVISHTGYNDLMNGQISSIGLQRQFDINYMQEQEKWADKVQSRKSVQNFGTVMSSVPAHIVCETFAKRVCQFESYAGSYTGGRFILGFQPFINSKKAISPLEAETISKYENNSHRFLHKQLPKLYDESDRLLKAGVKEYINFHEIFRQYGSESTMFLDTVHQLPETNSIIAEEYFKKLVNIFEV